MRIWRLMTEDAEFSLWLVPWFVPTGQDPIDMGWELHERLRKDPDDTLCLVAIEKNVIQGIVIAFKKKRVIWLWQVHLRKGFRYSLTLLNGLISWTKGKGIKRIRCKVRDERNRRLYELKYGFKSKRNKEMYLNV